MGGGRPISKPARWGNFGELLRPPLAAGGLQEIVAARAFLDAFGAIR